MSSLQLRPRFKKRVEIRSAEIIKRIHNYVQNPASTIEATTVDNHAILRILPEQQHYWSPQLNLEIHENDDGQGSILRGLFGPDPKVWTMFMFFYTGIGFIALIGLMYGLVQWSLAMPPSALWVALAATILEITCYLIARTGKKLAADQMEQLQDTLDRILE